MSNPNSPLSLIQTKEDAVRAVRLAQEVHRYRPDEGFEMVSGLALALAEALEDPTAAILGKLVEMFTDTENEYRRETGQEELSEAEVYLWVLEKAGLTAPMGERE